MTCMRLLLGFALAVAAYVPAEASPYRVIWTDAGVRHVATRHSHEAAKALADAVSSRSGVTLTLIKHDGRVVGHIGVCGPNGAVDWDPNPDHPPPHCNG